MIIVDDNDYFTRYRNFFFYVKFSMKNAKRHFSNDINFRGGSIIIKMIVFCLFYSQFLNKHTLFVGNWSLSTVLNNTYITDQSNIEISIRKFQKYGNLYWANAAFSFSSTQNFSLIFPFMKCHAISFPEREEIFLFKLIPNLSQNETRRIAIPVINEMMTKRDFSFFDLHHKLSEAFKANKSFTSFEAKIEILGREKAKISGHEIASMLEVKFNGFLVENNVQQKREIVFGVYRCIELIFSFYGWKSIEENFRTESSVMQLSLLSILLHGGIDFSCCFFVFSVTIDHVMPNVVLFAILFELYIYINYENLFIARAQIVHNICCRQFSQCLRTITFVIMQTCFVLAMYSLFWSIYKSPMICVLILYSFHLPQIIYSALNPSKKKNDSKFIIFTTISRVMQLFYFGIYDENFVHYQYKKEAIIGIAIMCIECIILLLQNRYGGRFFIPKTWRANNYDYFGHEIPEDSVCPICLAPMEREDIDNIMTTPCGHAFHAGCLQRWMEDETVCPFCRAELPLD